MNEAETDKIIRRCLAGDKKSFSELFAGYRNMVFHLAYNMVRDRETARDLVLEIFMEVYNKLPRFRGDCKFSTWLYRVGANFCLRYLRDQKAQKRYAKKETGIDIAHIGDPDVTVNPEKHLELKRIKEAVKKAVAGLAPDRCLIVTLADVQGLDLAEIADITRLPLGTVKSRLFRARRDLRQKLKYLVSENG